MTIVINAVKSGLWTDPTVWSVGRVPTLGDEVHANGFNIQIATNVVATEITTAAKNGGGGGGEFQAAADNLIITADIVAGTTTCLNLSAISPYRAKIIGNVYGTTNPAAASWVAGIYASSDLLDITGNVYGGGDMAANKGFAPAINFGELKKCKISGNIIGGYWWRCSGIHGWYPIELEIGGDIIGGINNYAPAVEAEGLNIIKINKLGGSITMQQNGSFPLAGCIVFDTSVDIKMSVNTTSGKVKIGKIGKIGKGVWLSGGVLCQA